MRKTKYCMKEQELNKHIQTALNKLISDEWFAGQIYKNFAMLVKQDDRASIYDEMMDTASDEINDHYVKLIKFALANGYSIPATYVEMKKFADIDDIKLFEKAQKNKDATYYLKISVDAEQRAIDTYEKFLQDKDVMSNVDMQMILKNNYYDEIEHLKTFKFSLDSIDAMKNFPQ